MYINACFFSTKQEKMSDFEDFKSTQMSTKQMRMALNCKYNIVVNFSESHDNYYSAYKYI